MDRTPQAQVPTEARDKNKGKGGEEMSFRE